MLLSDQGLRNPLTVSGALCASVSSEEPLNKLSLIGDMVLNPFCVPWFSY